MSAEIIEISEHRANNRRGRGDAAEEFISSPKLQALGLEPYDGRFKPWDTTQVAAIVRAADLLRAAFPESDIFDSGLVAKASRVLSLAGVGCTIQAIELDNEQHFWSGLSPARRAMVWLCSSDTERATIWGTAGIGGEVFFTRYGVITEVWERGSGEGGPDHAA